MFSPWKSTKKHPGSSLLPQPTQAAIAKLSDVERNSKSERERMRAEVEQDEIGKKNGEMCLWENGQLVGGWWLMVNDG